MILTFSWLGSLEQMFWAYIEKNSSLGAPEKVNTYMLAICGDCFMFAQHCY